MRRIKLGVEKAFKKEGMGNNIMTNDEKCDMERKEDSTNPETAHRVTSSENVFPIFPQKVQHNVSLSTWNMHTSLYTFIGDDLWRRKRKCL